MRISTPALAVALTLVGCGDDAPYGDYNQSKVTSIAPGSDAVVVHSGDDDAGCLDVGADECLDLDDVNSDWCERDGGPVDVIVHDGEVIDVICYPPSTDSNRPLVTIDENSDSEINVAQNANRTTVVFNDALDGEAIEANLSVDGNNVAIYGNGIGDTIIDGDVTISGNNARLRGLTITGDLTIEKNNAAVVFVRVLGDVRFTKNNGLLVESDVFGDLAATSNNTKLLGNAVQGSINVGGNNTLCVENRSFVDENEDSSIDDEELGDLIGGC